MTRPSRSGPAPLVWWSLWFGITGGLIAIHGVIPPSETPSTTGALRYLPLLPLFVASAIRWLVLRRMTDGLRAFPLFVVGLAMAEGCSLLGLFLVPELRQTYLALGVFTLAQYAPFFVSQYRSDRAG